ncbi:putative Xaa-Pro aminopeptidase [Lachnellula occidentalis]|uniref:Xaa-Pro aminopeptidase n=1 Tax=Lachnellula occidentalis TaxID=215460 RepID=A0A8H8UDJ3_9HELO|nr:putative Xaa-Pro aminopeptidase [Lachnellula occidentalis]
MASIQMPGEDSNSETDWIVLDSADIYNSLEDGEGIEKYPAKEHARAVAKRLGVKQGLIFLPGVPSKTYQDSDQEIPFRQRRYFYYLSGISHPDCLVTYDIGRDAVCAWIPPPNTGRKVIYNGFTPSRTQIRAITDVSCVAETYHLKQYLKSYVKNSRSPAKFYLLHKSQMPTLLQHLVNDDGCDILATKCQFDFTKLQPAMDAARVIKSEHELKLIRKACDITQKAHVNVLCCLKDLENETEIEAIFAGTCIAEQAKHQAYGIIAGSGENASTLHYAANNEPLEGRQLVCLDAGVEWKEYASDVTRTFPISGKWTPEAKGIYDIVAKMQDECIAMVKPGADYRQIHMHAHKVAIKGLLELGLLQNGTWQELYSSGVSVAFFPHGLGHYMGLEVHDVGAHGALLYGFPQTTRVNWETAYFSMGIANPSLLEPGMVITVEPGIYFSRYALEQVYLKDAKFAKYINASLLDTYYAVGGVRIEDDILVTQHGYENLTSGVPKGEEALKIIRGEKEKKGWFW